MKKAILPIFVLAMLLALVSAASAGETAEPIKFTIGGNTTGIGEFEQEGCKLEFKDLTAEGFVYDGLDGSFTYVEEGEINICPPSPGGSNEGVMTIETDQGTLVIEFKGRTDLRSVWGVWELKSAAGTGDYAGIEGDGEYFGDAENPPYSGFVVTFDGSFYTDLD